MNKVKISDQTHPFKLTVNKLREFQKESGLKLSEFDNMSFEDMLRLVYKGIEGGYKIDKKEIPFTMDELGDLIEFKDLVKLFTEAMSDMNDGNSDPN